MAFGGGINPNTPVTVSTTAGGTGDRTRLVSPLVPGRGGSTESVSGGTRVRSVLPATAGIFGGTSTKTTKNEEVSEQWQGDARRAETFNPPINMLGPLVAPVLDVGGPQPIHRFPKEVAELFVLALDRGRGR